MQKYKMADDEWQLEAVHEQLNVFDTLTTPYEKIQSTDLQRVIVEVAKIRSLHLKMNKTTKSVRHISAEIMKHPDGDEIKLSFIVVVTNIEMNGSLCKMPIFVMMSSGGKIFIDMNLTLFHSWEAFLKNNDFPPCQYCFPVGGQYCVGEKLKIDFASSPATIRQNVNFMWRGLGFVVSVGLVVGSFFFTIPPINHSRADSLLSIANEFVPSIKKYVGMILRAVTIVEKLKSGCMDILQVLPELCKFLKEINDNFSEEISWVFDKVRDALWKLYSWIKEKLSPFFENASVWAQHMFIAVTSRVDNEIITVESEAQEILEASRRNNCQSQTTVVAAAIHAQDDIGRGTGYAKTIFRNAKNESALQNGMSNKDNENLHPITKDLLEISSILAQKLGKRTLKDAQDTFEALSSIVKDEYKNKIEMYSKNLDAARAAGVGHKIDLDVYNRSLGIKGDPKEYYWQEVIISIMESRLVYRIKEKIENIEKQKKILILPIDKQDEDDVDGVYRLVGVSGAGKFTASELVKALKETQFGLSEAELVTNETSSVIMIRTEDLTLAAIQELKSDNTSEGILLVVKTKE